METVPTEIKKQNIISYLTPYQRVVLAETSKRELQWLRPILHFMQMPLKDKIVFLKTSPITHDSATDDIIMEYLSKQHDQVLLISLLTELPDQKHRRLKKKIRVLIEDRLRDRNYRKLIKKTLLQLYLQYLNNEDRPIPAFLKTIESPEVRSLAIEQYLLLKKDDVSPNTLKKWVEKIPDEYTRARVRRNLHIMG